MAIKGPNGQEIDPAAMNPTTMDTLPKDAFAGATAPDLAAMPADAMGGMDAPMMDDPGSEAQEPDMPPPEYPIV